MLSGPFYFRIRVRAQHVDAPTLKGSDEWTVAGGKRRAEPPLTLDPPTLLLPLGPDPQQQINPTQPEEDIGRPSGHQRRKLVQVAHRLEEAGERPVEEGDGNA